jgi:hypothetical protein
VWNGWQDCRYPAGDVPHHVSRSTRVLGPLLATDVHHKRRVHGPANAPVHVPVLVSVRMPMPTRGPKPALMFVTKVRAVAVDWLLCQ